MLKSSHFGWLAAVLILTGTVAYYVGAQTPQPHADKPTTPPNPAFPQQIVIKAESINVLDPDMEARRLPIDGKVINVHDGDTLTFQATDGRIIKVRLAGIDAPEMASGRRWGKQPGSDESKAWALAFVKDAPALFLPTGKRTYGRPLGDIIIDGKSFSRESVRAGMSWWYAHYSGEDLDLMRLQKQAQKNKAGIWKKDQNINPHDWRQGVK